MYARRFEILPLRDTPEPYTWVSITEADYFTVYERDDDDLAHARVDLPSFDHALAFALVRTEAPVELWTGTMFVTVSAPPIAMLKSGVPVSQAPRGTP